MNEKIPNNESIENTDSKKIKTKKEKVIYYDDGSTISDMSGLNETKKGIFKNQNNSVKPRATEKEKLSTFFSVFKMMLGPTFIALCVIGLLYFFMCLITGNL